MAEIITLDDVKDHLAIRGDGRDDRLRLLTHGVDAYVRAKTARDWAETVRTDEAYQGNDLDTLILAGKPASLLTACSVRGTAIDVADDDQVVLDETKAILYRTNGSVWPESRKFDILVSYTGGRRAPDDLKLAALEICAWINNSSGGKMQVIAGGQNMTLYARALSDLPQAADIIEFYTDHATRWQTAPLGQRAGPGLFPAGGSSGL